MGTSWFQNTDEWAALPADSGPAEWQRIDVVVDLTRQVGTGPKSPGRRVDIVTPAQAIDVVEYPDITVSNYHMGEQDLSFDVSQVGVPVLVKVSYFPNWEVDGAMGPYRVAPNFMVVIPTSTHVHLHYEASTSDKFFYLLTLVGIGLLVFWRRRGDVVHANTHPFLDTPGHEAFTAMRARGANLTDIAVIVIAADDGIMPQTKEAIQHAQAADVAMIVAINKADLRTANVDRVKRQLRQLGLVPEEWGGDLICCTVSATKGDGMDNLLEMILLQADMLELQANPRRKAQGYVIESRLEAGMGPTANVLIANGTLKLNDAVVSGSSWGRIKAMINDQGKRVRTAGPSAAVKLLGLTSVPEPGEEFHVYKNDREARTVAEERVAAARLQELTAAAAPVAPKTLEELLQEQVGSDKRTLKVILKTDVLGSLEAIRDSLKEIKSDKVDLEIIGTGVGNVTPNDVLLASASQAVILGFHVAKDPGASAEAKRHGVEIRLYAIIYQMLDDIRNLMTGLLDPVLKEHIHGQAAIRQIFDMGKRGKVAGCMCTKGKITLKGRVRVKRKDEVIYEGKIQSLRRFQNEASEVREGQECGIVLDHFSNFTEGDTIESYEIEKVAQEL